MLIENQYVDMIWHSPAKQWYIDKGYKFTKMRDVFRVKVEDLPLDSKKEVEAICDYCNEEQHVKYTAYNNRTKNGTEKYACDKCRKLKRDDYRTDKDIYFNRFIKICEEIGYIPISTIDDYKTVHSKMRFICPVHGEQEMSYKSIKSGSICYQCSRDNVGKGNAKSIQDVIDVVESKNGNKLINPNDYTSMKDKNLRILCGSCGDEFVASLMTLTTGGGACQKCRPQKISETCKFSPEQVTKIINSVNGNVLMNADEYIRIDIPNLKIKCGECGNIFTTRLSTYMWGDKVRCGHCAHSISSGERMVTNFLECSNIEFISEKSFKDCRDKRPLLFDFYLPHYNICIEYDGQQHYEPVFGQKPFKTTQKHDKMKNEYCENKDIKLIRIPYWEGHRIEEILTEELNLETKTA